MTRRERRLARAERLRGWTAKRAAKSAAGFDRAHQIADGIPFGQPILVGHHSEGCARRDADRIDAGMRAGVENGRKAEEMGQRAANIERATEHAIYSDDADAGERLMERIATLEAKQARMKEINAAIRKGISLDTLDLTEREKAELMSSARHAGTKGYPSYALSNNNGNLQRYKKRLEGFSRPPRPRWITVRYPGECATCQRAIERGEMAQYNRESKELRCQACAKEQEEGGKMADVIQTDEVVNAKEGDLRVWWIRNPPSPAEYHIVHNVDEAAVLLDTLAENDLATSSVHANVGGLEVYEDGEWCEWYNEDGNDIDAEGLGLIRRHTDEAGAA